MMARNLVAGSFYLDTDKKRVIQYAGSGIDRRGSSCFVFHFFDHLTGDQESVRWIEECEKLVDRKSTRLNSSHLKLSRMPSSA